MALNLTDDIVSGYAKQTYDAVWAMGLALRKTNNLMNFHYKRKDMAKKFVSTMESLHFMGVSVGIISCVLF